MYRINYARWAFKVIAWDAALPACVAFLPMGVKFLFPGHRGVLEITAVILPIVAFLLRFISGKHHIDSNQCSNRTRTIQLGIFCLGILPLVLFDCFMILSELMPNGLSEMREDLGIWIILLSVYLISMVIAMYPGPTEVPEEDLENLLAYRDRWMNEG